MKMDAVAFIKNDVQKDQANSGLIILFVALVTLSAPVLMGILMRRDLIGVFEARNLAPHLISAILLALFPVICLKKGEIRGSAILWAYLALLLSGLFSAERALLPDGPRTLYALKGSFLRESILCFEKGCLTVFVMGIWLSFFSFQIASLPSRRWRLLTSIAGGLSAAVMLAFHCDSSSVPHVLIGHFGSGIFLGIGLYLTQEFLFRLRLNASFSGLFQRVCGSRKIS